MVGIGSGSNNGDGLRFAITGRVDPSPSPRLGGSPGGSAPFMGGRYCPLGGGVPPKGGGVRVDGWTNSTSDRETDH